MKFPEFLIDISMKGDASMTTLNKVKLNLSKAGQRLDPIRLASHSRTIMNYGQKLKSAALKVNEKIANWLGFNNFGYYGLQPAVTGIQNDSISKINERALEELLHAPLHFGVGKPPMWGTKARKIFKFNDVQVGPKSGQIRCYKAKELADKMLKPMKATHEYIASEAVKLTESSEAETYRLHIQLGALGEDHEFLPGENIDNLIIRGELPSSRQLNRSMGSGGGVYSALASGVRWFSRKVLGRKSDPLNRPYNAHFYDPLRRPGYQGLYIEAFDTQLQSAAVRARMYFIQAVKDYRAGKIGLAFYKIGHAIHLVSDISGVPAHVWNDIHGPTWLLGKKDSLEQFMISGGYANEGEPNVRLWSRRDWSTIGLKNPEVNKGWKILEFLYYLAMRTKRFRSVDKKGLPLTVEDLGEFEKEVEENIRSNGPAGLSKELIENKSLWNQQKTGQLNDQECIIQGSTQIPKAITDSAEILNAFLYFSRLKRRR